MPFKILIEYAYRDKSEEEFTPHWKEYMKSCKFRSHAGCVSSFRKIACQTLKKRGLQACGIESHQINPIKWLIKRNVGFKHAGSHHIKWLI